MAQMMFREQQAMLPIVIGGGGSQLLGQPLLLKKFVFEPYRHGLAERIEASRRKGKIGFEQSLKFQKRFVVKRDPIDIGETDASLRQAISDCACWVSTVELLAGEPLLLGS